MRCVAYCTADSYQLNKMANHFKSKKYKTKFFHDVLYVTHPKQTIDIFFFSIGCFVSWGLTNRAEKEILQQALAFANNPLDEIEVDHFSFRYGAQTNLVTHDRLDADLIILENEEPTLKIAIAYGLAQSVKLEAYEESVLQAIKKNEHLPHELASKGKISLSGKAISMRMGEIFLERSWVNLSSEYLDMPEYFWQHSSLEDYYLMSEKFLDITSRVASLNQRLDVLHELFGILTSQLQHRHSSMLEIIIIVLIFIEVIMNSLLLFDPKLFG